MPMPMPMPPKKIPKAEGCTVTMYNFSLVLDLEVAQIGNSRMLTHVLSIATFKAGPYTSTLAHVLGSPAQNLFCRFILRN
jgi:hypothetical protein